MKNLLFVIAIAAMAMLSPGCKKSSSDPVCRLTRIFFDSNDTIDLSYNGNGSLISLQQKFFGTLFNHSYSYSGSQSVHTISTASLPAPIVNTYNLSAGGNLDQYTFTEVDGADTYVHNVQFKYNGEGQMIWSETKTTKNGAAYVSWKDSMNYQNGNQVSKYTFYKSGVGSYGLHRYQTSTYSTQLNNVGMYIFSMLEFPTDITGSTFMESYWPYVCHLLGKGSVNVPIQTIAFDGSAAEVLRVTYTSTFDTNDFISQQTMSSVPAQPSIDRTRTFKYTCN